ncbi:MAG: TIGR00730 family Rossman fold protein [Bacteroidales bacterium]|nr:TIGR00730 family Rossman fold protein [Bacteroidales bacterium]
MKQANELKSIAVFCGSSQGTNKQYRDQACELGRFLAEEGIEIIYGGAKVGLMGHLAKGALAAQGDITGVIPGFLKEKEIAHDQLTRLIQVESMHERKQRMHELSDGVIALPGGYGTLEEFFETLTWGQLGLHRKPVALLNINGFYDPLKQLTDSMVREGFLNPVNRQMLIISSDITELIKQMKEQPVPLSDKWTNQKQW